MGRVAAEPIPPREFGALPEVAALAATTPEWTEHAAKTLLAAAGIPVTREEEVDSAGAAARAAERIGYPVVLKSAGPDVAHKTEAGGVRIGLRSPEELAAAADDLLARAPLLLVAEHRRADLELIVSAFVDEQFGPCGLIGLGGVWTEAVRESVVVVGPGSTVMIRRALGSNRWGRLILEGARGRRFAADRVVECCLRLLDLIADCRGHVRTVEINPLFVDGDDVVAVDALIEPR